MNCGRCHSLLVHRIKEIRFHKWNDSHTHVVTVRQQCPMCGENELYVTFIKADGTKDTHKIVTCNLQNGILVTEEGRVFHSIIEYDSFV